MGKFSRDKGARVERKIVNILRESGFTCQRVAISGSAGGKFSGDVSIVLHGDTYIGEVKARKQGAGFKTIETWMEKAEILFLVSNNNEPLVVSRLGDFIKLVEEKNG